MHAKRTWFTGRFSRSMARVAGRTLALVLGLPAALVMAATVEAAQFYVDGSHPSANDANPGTETLPWLTVGRINTAPLAPGDVVFVKVGTYDIPTTGGSFLCPAVGPPVGGTPGNPITIRSFPGHAVVVRNTVPGRDAGVIGTCRSHVVIKGFEVDGGDAHFGILASGTSAAVRLNGVVIEDNIVHNLFHTSTVSDNVDGIALNFTSGTVIRNNVVFDVENANGSDNASGVKMNQPNNDTIIENNEFYQIRAAIFDKTQNVNTVIRRNYIHNVDRGILVSCFGAETIPCQGGQFYQNVIANVREAIAIGSDVGTTPFPNYTVYNNTIYIPTCVSGGCLGIQSNPTPNLRLWNNIMHLPSGQTTMNLNNANSDVTLSDFSNFFPSPRFANNDMTFSSLAQWRLATGRDLNSLSVDPMFVGPLTGTPPATAFRLGTGSPLINAGRVDGTTGSLPVNMGAFINPGDVVGPVPAGPPFDPSFLRVR